MDTLKVLSLIIFRTLCALILRPKSGLGFWIIYNDQDWEYIKTGLYSVLNSTHCPKFNLP